MRRRRLVKALLGLGGLVAIAGLLWCWGTEPVIEGKSLGTWVDEIAEPSAYEGQQLAIDQLQTVAPLAIARILGAMAEAQAAQDPNRLTNYFRQRLVSLYPRLPVFLRSRIRAPRNLSSFDRGSWLGALEKLGPRDERVFAALNRELASGDYNLRFTGAFHLGNLATNWIDDPVRRMEIVSTLTRLLDDPADNVRGGAAVGLGNLGSLARPAVPALLRRIAVNDDSTDPLLIRALPLIGGDPLQILPVVTNLLISRNRNVRARAAYVVCHFSGEVGIGLPILRQILNEVVDETEDESRATAAALIGRLGPRAAAALPDLERLLNHPDVSLRTSTAMAVWRISGDHRLAVPVLRTALQRGERHHCIVIPEFLGEMGPAASDATPELVAALKDQDFLIRRNAVLALGQIGSGARAATPDLILRLKDRLPSIRADAARALARINPP